MGATTIFADKTDGMGIINHDQRVVFIRQIANAFQVSDYPIHREHAISGDQDMTSARFTRFFQASFQFHHIVVGVTETFCFTQTHAINDRSVVQGIGNNCVFCAQQRFKQAAVGVEARRVKDGIFHTEECRQFLLQLFMAVLGTANKANRSHTKSVRIHTRFCRCNQFRMVSQSQIVVRTKVNNVASIRHGDIRLLGRCNNAFFFKQSFRTCGFEIVR